MLKRLCQQAPDKLRTRHQGAKTRRSTKGVNQWDHRFVRLCVFAAWLVFRFLLGPAGRDFG